MLCMLISAVDSPEDKRKIVQLYEKYNRLMYVIAYKILNNVEDSEDAVLESWEKIIRNLDKIKKIDGQETKGLIVIIVERTAIDLYRKNKKRYNRVVSFAEYDDFPFMATHDRQLENAELYETMRQMQKKYTEVLILHYINGLTGKEMADLLQMKEDSVMKRLSRARKLLEKELNKNN